MKTDKLKGLITIKITWFKGIKSKPNAKNKINRENKILFFNIKNVNSFNSF